MNFPEIGTLAPDFSLQNEKGELVHLKDFRDKKRVLLYFYPKASTPGCTTQACGLRDIKNELDDLNVVALGVSPDLPAALQKFASKQTLNFSLLSDPDHKVAEAYGAWGLKKFMGREYMGILRTTFFIDECGRLRQIFDKINTKNHHNDMLLYLK
jgi:thioredoxin-dependent peroxiredoxin